MKIRWRLFNIYFPLALALAFTANCMSADQRSQKKQASTIRLHLESSQSDRSTPVQILRENPISLRIERDPILDEGNLLSAALIEDRGGFAIALKFDAHGSLVLNTSTTANRGRRIAVLSHFGETRWLGAPRITGPINSGVFTFTPDASREEAERIVRGLNNVVKKMTSKFPY